MSFSELSAGTAGLRAFAEDPTTEIFLVDAALGPRASGVGELEWWGAPGLYKVRFRAGATQVDQLVELTSGPEPLDLPFTHVHFASPVPLEGTSTSHEYHQGGAIQLSGATDATLGTGARLLVLVRDYDPVPDDGQSIAAGLTLHDGDGRLLYTFADGREERGARWAGAHLEVDPGVYRLRMTMDARRVLEQSVVACAGWGTQVYLARADEPGVPRPVPDLAGAAVLMARAGTVFDPRSAPLRWTEMLRRALEHGRPAVPTWGPRLDAIRAAMGENPMLGLLAAHVLLGGGDSSRALAGEIVDGLDPALADHPDVAAVRLALRPDSPVRPFDAPPMLRSSWEVVLAASARDPRLMGEDSLSARAAPRVVPSGAWLVWGLPDEPVRRERVMREGVIAENNVPWNAAAALAELEAVVARTRDPEALELGIDASFTPEEANLLRLLWLQALEPDDDVRRPTFRDGDADVPVIDGVEAPLSPPAPALGMEEMVRALRLPPTAIHGAARGLLEKLARPAE